MPRVELVINENGKEDKFIMYINSDDMTILVKDKYLNWKDLVFHLY
jgi:hypothetical protein